MSSRDKCEYGMVGRRVLVALLTLSLGLGGTPVEAWAEMTDEATAESVPIVQEQETETGPVDAASPVEPIDETAADEEASTEDVGQNEDQQAEDVSSPADSVPVDEHDDSDNASMVESDEVAEEPANAPDDAPATPVADTAPLGASDLVDWGTCGGCSWSVDKDGLLKIWPTNGTKGKLANSRGYASEDYPEDNYFPWYVYAEQITSVSMSSGVQLPSNMSAMFFNCRWLRTVDTSKWDTSAVTDMSSVFQNCSNLESVDVSNWDTSKVKTMEGLFAGCGKLRRLDVSKWNTSSVTNMCSTFGVCSELQELDLSGWDTSKVVDMCALFSYCHSLVSLNVSGWNTSRVTDMFSVFLGCWSLSSLDLSSWDTSSVERFDRAFYGADSLNSISVGEKLDIESMFPDPAMNPRWYSNRAGRWYAGYEIAGRNGIADTYTTYETQAGDISKATCPTIASQVYTGSEMRPTVTVKLNGKTLSEDMYRLSYSDNTNVGTARVLITGRQGYVGSKTITFKITPAKISEAYVRDIEDQTYSGKAITPAPSVLFGDRTLVNGVDYTMSYKNNTKAGTATITYTGKGNFTGTKTVTFKIVDKTPAKTSVAKATVSSILDQTYTGKAITPSPTVKVGSTTLRSGTDYTLSYKNNTNVGTATVTITGRGNYTGTKSVTFNIVEKVATQQMYRLYNRNSGEHFYTAKAKERDALRGVGWTYEGVGWVAPVSSKTPVYRLYNGIAGDHHYTTKPAERDYLVGQGWTYEGVGWYSDDAKGTPLYREYNPNAVTGSHNYTTNKKEHDALVKQYGWISEGIGWYGVK